MKEPRQRIKKPVVETLFITENKLGEKIKGRKWSINDKGSVAEGEGKD